MDDGPHKQDAPPAKVLGSLNMRLTKVNVPTVLRQNYYSIDNDSASENNEHELFSRSKRFMRR